MLGFCLSFPSSSSSSSMTVLLPKLSTRQVYSSRSDGENENRRVSLESFGVLTSSEIPTSRLQRCMLNRTPRPTLIYL